MSRSQPYRGKMPVHILQLLDVASRITLFMVGQSGPLSFTFKDRLNQKYKTSIGDQVKCSCSSGRNDHCIHTIYVMLKVFKVSIDNPIMWQAAYVDSQLSNLVSGKYTINTKKRIVRPTFDEYSELPSESIFKKQTQKLLTFPEQKAEKMKLNEESVCPICQDTMNQDMCLSYCKVGCGNNFHLQCLKVWAEHKKSSQTKITCPMCRAPYGENYLRQIQLEQRVYKKKQRQKIKITFKCQGCGLDNIPHSVHKCLLCTSFELCQCCYKANKHIKHPFVRQSKDNSDKWCGAQERRQAQLKMKNFIDNKRKQKNVNEKLIEKLRKVEQDPTKLLDYVASSYPYVSKYISDNIDPNKKLGFDAADMRCMKCYSKKMIFLRRLTCGHFIDHECLKDNLVKGKYFCEECGTKVVKGYENLISKQKQIQNIVQQEGFNVSEEFNPKKMQMPVRHSEEYNFVREEEEPTLIDVLGGQFRERSRATQNQRFNSQRIRERISSNIVREPIIEQQYGRHSHRSRKRQEEKVSREPRDIPSNNSIRIRNVSRGSHNNKELNHPPRHSQHKAHKKRFDREQMGNMLEAMLGRKLI